MSAGCLRRALAHAVRVVYRPCSGFGMPITRFSICHERCGILTASLRWAFLSTAAGDIGKTPAPVKKRQGHQAHTTICSVGRLIPHPQIQLLSETAENLGVMHRAEALRIMDERGLKLVLLNERKVPPIYQLMSGKQIHEEQMKLQEKQKAKPAPVQVKELVLSSSISPHDLKIKLKQVESWLAKKDHVKITLRKRKQQLADMDVALKDILQNIEVTVGFVSKPQVIQNGNAAMCVLRLPSEKELSQKKNDSSSVPSAQTNTSQITLSQIQEGSGDDGTKQ
ncbi:translation initiation factor IF-3, mitochondrial [Thalassophryne amazonica]|uniref:translation initiation factor IF-3, mitochondrial n=1 Tax=Thalassophryne amazonica TaxID=390379 RepID=UPI0014709DD1|nr:translation initiation factor IF-3, mitochondrial [Thalassophryne amazonica]